MQFWNIDYHKRAKNNEIITLEYSQKIGLYTFRLALMVNTIFIKNVHRLWQCNFHTLNNKWKLRCYLSGDGLDFMNVALREGGIILTMNLGSGVFETDVKPQRGNVRFDDNLWHKLEVEREAREVSVLKYFLNNYLSYFNPHKRAGPFYQAILPILTFNLSYNKHLSMLTSTLCL